MRRARRGQRPTRAVLRAHRAVRRTVEPISCSDRQRCQRQWTMLHTVAQQAVERQRSGTVHDVPAEQCCPEQVLVLRCARELRPQVSTSISSATGLPRSPTAMSTGPMTRAMIIGHAAGKSAAPMPGNIPRAKKAFARARRTRRSTTGAAARPAAPLRSSSLASRVRSRSSRANVVKFIPRPRFARAFGCGDRHGRLRQTDNVARDSSLPVSGRINSPR